MKKCLQETFNLPPVCRPAGGAAVLLFLFALSFAGCKPKTSNEAPKKSEPPISVKLIQPKKGNIIRSVSLPANITANQQATLYSKAAGYLKTITVDKGDEVKRGQLLAEIEVPELIADRVKYKAEAAVAAIEYQRLDDSLKKAPDLVVPQSVDAARGRLEVARANLERIDTLLGFAKITAPFSGVVTKRMVDPGAFIPVATGGSAAQNAAVVTLMDFDRVRVQVAVPENEVPLIQKGLPAKVLVDELPGRNFEGSVTRFSPALDEASKTMLVEIDLENPKRELRPGMFATVKLGVEKHSDAWLVPVEAVVIEKAGASIFIVADGKAKKIPVKTGFNDGASVEILDGLAPNQAVILAGRLTLNNGQPVAVAEAK